MSSHSYPRNQPCSFPTNNHEKERLKNMLKQIYSFFSFLPPFFPFKNSRFFPSKPGRFFFFSACFLCAHSSWLFFFFASCLFIVYPQFPPLTLPSSAMPDYPSFECPQRDSSRYSTPDSPLLSTPHSSPPSEPVRPSTPSASSGTPGSSGLVAAACGCPCELSDADWCPLPPFPSACRIECYHRAQRARLLCDHIVYGGCHAADRLRISV